MPAGGGSASSEPVPAATATVFVEEDTRDVEEVEEEPVGSKFVEEPESVA